MLGAFTGRSRPLIHSFPVYEPNHQPARPLKRKDHVNLAIRFRDFPLPPYLEAYRSARTTRNSLDNSDVSVTSDPSPFKGKSFNRSACLMNSVVFETKALNLCPNPVSCDRSNSSKLFLIQLQVQDDSSLLEILFGLGSPRYKLR